MATSKRIMKIILLVVFILIGGLYLPLLLHIPEPDTNDLDNLYEKFKDPKQRESSFAKFIAHGDEAVDYLLKKLPSEEDVFVKTKILNLIGGVGCVNCAEEIVPLLEDPNWRVRFSTIDSLDNLGYENMHSLLIEAIKTDTNKKVKINAILKLRKYGNAEDSAFLEELAVKKEFSDKNLNKAISITIPELKSKNNIK